MHLSKKNMLKLNQTRNIFYTKKTDVPHFLVSEGSKCQSFLSSKCLLRFTSKSVDTKLHLKQSKGNNSENIQARVKSALYSKL